MDEIPKTKKKLSGYGFKKKADEKKHKNKQSSSFLNTWLQDGIINRQSGRLIL